MMETSTFLRWDNQYPKICSHCAIPFSEKFGEEELMQNFDSTIKISSSSLREFLLQALSSIFKLNYLNPFDVQDEDEELENFELCQNCAQVLVNLHQLYNNFTQLGKLDCYLDKKLQQLERIINHHQDKTINCDLITPPPQQKSILEVKQKESSSTGNDCKNNSNPSKFLLDGRELIILLKRLPAKYLQQIENSNSPSQEDENDPELYPEVKTEVEDDFSMDHDSSPPSSPQEWDYNEKPIKNKSTKQGGGILRRKNIVKKSSSSLKKLNSKNKSTPLKTSWLSLKDSFFTPTWAIYLNKKLNFANPCWYCEKHFETLDSCIQHTQEAHLPKTEDPESLIICSRCAKISSGSKGHGKHVKRCQVSVSVGVTMPKRYKCPECPKVFPVETKLQRHMKRHTDQRPFACDDCPYQAKCPKTLNSHKLNIHMPKRFKCPECPKVFPVDAQLQSHMKRHTDQRPFACDKCPYQAKCPTTLNKHKLNIHLHDPKEPKIKCDECPRYVKNARYLYNHKLNMHHPEGHKKYLEWQEARKVQYKEKRVNAPPPVTFCEDCNVNFFSRSSLLNHRQKFHGDNMGKEYGCEKCGKYFTSLNNLNVHMKKVHSDLRPFMCDQCGKAFKSSSSLSTHKDIVHTADGRERFNQKVRERTQRLKIIASQLASVHNPN